MKNKSPDLWLFFYLFSRCILLLSVLSLVGVFFGQIVSFIKTGSNISFSKEDVFFVFKVGFGVGGFLGAGLWIIAKLDFYFKN